MDLCGGCFRPGWDHSIAAHRDGEFLGGFVCCNYMGNAIAIHDGAVARDWCSREIMWMLFHYVFRQLGCHKAYAPVPSDNTRALELNLRAGWKLDTVLRDALAPGRHLILLSMEAGACRWLQLQPHRYYPTTVVRSLPGYEQTERPGRPELRTDCPGG
jgi:hypothetical protein